MRKNGICVTASFLVLMSLLAVSSVHAGVTFTTREVSIPMACAANASGNSVDACKVCHIVADNPPPAGMNASAPLMAFTMMASPASPTTTVTSPDGRFTVTYPPQVDIGESFSNDVTVWGYAVRYKYFLDNVLAFSSYPFGYLDYTYSHPNSFDQAGDHTFKSQIFYCQNGSDVCWYGWLITDITWDVTVGSSCDVAIANFQASSPTLNTSAGESATFLGNVISSKAIEWQIDIVAPDPPPGDPGEKIVASFAGVGNAVSAIWDGRDNSLNFVPAGDYLARLTAVTGPSCDVQATTTVSVTRTPVILIPGVMATKLYSGSELVWIDESDFKWPGDAFLDPLALNADGATDIDSNRPINLFRDAPNQVTFSYWNQNIRANDYKGIFDRLVAEGYTPTSAANIGDFSYFAYDWRKAPDDQESVINHLRERIMQITNNGDREVDLVAHSLGGLVVKAYLNQYGAQSHVRKVITVGTPHVGLAKAFRSLQFGWWGFGPWRDLVISENEIMKISQNWRVPYAGVPGDAYYSNAGYGTIFKERDADMDNNGVYEEWNNNKVRNYLTVGHYFKWWWANPTLEKDLPHNKDLADIGRIFHDGSDLLVTWAPNAGEVHLVASRGLSTLTQMELYNPHDPNFENAWALTNHMESGDGTVPTKSASLENDGSYSANVSRYWVANGEHAYLLKNNFTVAQLVADILAGRSTQHPGVETSAPVSDTVSAIELEVNCPVDVHIYDARGSHVGPVGDRKIEYGIGDVVYDRVSSSDGYTTTAYLPTDRPFTVWFYATNSGKFRLAIRTIENNVITRTVIYDDVSLLPTTIASFNVPAPVSFGTLAVDLDGDGTVDQQLPANAELSRDEREDHEAPTTSITLQGTLGENGYYRSQVQVFLNAYDSLGGSGVQRTEYRIGDGSWIRYADSFPLTQECGVVLDYRSLDYSYNLEVDQSTAVQIDITAPVVTSFMLSPNVLWPPNHRMVEVTPAVTTSDNCGGQVNWMVKSVTMNEGDQVNTYDPLYDQHVENGNTVGDMQVIGGKLYLRAERAGQSAGRIYTVTLSAKDRAGNATLAKALVSVPHDQK